MVLKNSFFDQYNVPTDMSKLLSGSLKTKHAQTQSNANTFESEFQKKKDLSADYNDREQISRKPKPKNDRTNTIKDKTRNTSNDNVLKTNTPPSRAEASKTDNAQENVKATVDLYDKAAEALNISKEDLLKTLESLNITLEDLATPENMTKFLMEVNNITDPLELLNVPNIASMIKSLQDISQQLQQLEPVSLEAIAAVTTDSAIMVPELNEAVIQHQTEETTEVLSQQTQILDDKLNKPQTKVAENIDTNAVAEEVVEEANTGTVQQNNNNTETKDQNSNQYQTQDQGTGNNNSKPIFDTDKAPVITQIGETTIIERPDGKIEIRQAQRTEGGNIVQQVIDKVKVNFNVGTTEIKINLTPEDLGTVTLRVLSENGVLTAKILADTPQAKDAIVAGIEDLKKSLEDKGLEIKDVSVEVGTDNSKDQMQQFLSAQQKSDRRISQMIDKIRAEEELEINEETKPNNSNGVSGTTVDYTA